MTEEIRAIDDEVGFYYSSVVRTSHTGERMRLQDFLNLPPEHTVPYEDGRELHEDIARNRFAALSTEQSDRLLKYLEVCLLHKAVDPELEEKIEAVYSHLKDEKDGE